MNPNNEIELKMTTNKYNRVEGQFYGEAKGQLSSRQFKKLHSNTSAFIANSANGFIVVIDEGNKLHTETPFTPSNVLRRHEPWQPFSYNVTQKRGQQVGTHN